jgi:DNA modification methylase
MTVPYYQDENVTIFHGDCREIMPQLSFDVVVTDPPYGIGWSRGANAGRSSAAHAGILNDHDTTARDEAHAISGHDRPAIMFGSFYAPAPVNVKQILVWHKPNDAGVVGSTTGFRRDAEPIYLCGDIAKRTVQWSSVLKSTRLCIREIAEQSGHPHAKPEDIVRQLIELNAGVILDPFMGSGTTLRAAKDLGRHAIGIELDEQYCEIAATRMGQGVLDFGATE